MFSISNHTHQYSSIGGYYLLHYLFLLHICTAFLMIVTAFNNDLNDNEAIIQLSMDSIHVLKSSDPHPASTEENNNEEKQLLLTLLRSYDEEIKINRHVDYEIPLTDSSSSIRFIPPVLHFPEQSIAIPRMQTVMIINDCSEPLELYSLSGTTSEFYSSFSEQNVLPSSGGNISINVYYLPRVIGERKCIFTLKTNRGDMDYHINGRGTENPFHLRPLINATIPLNSTFEYTIHFYNPYHYPLDINEIYTSDDNLIIELLSKKTMKNKITKIFEHYEQWHLKPYEIKSIIKINYFAYKLNHLHGFICIKTNSTDLIILPVEINVSNRSGLYSNVDLLKFTADRFLRSETTPITIPIYVFNNGLDPVMITDVRVTEEYKNYTTVYFKNLPIPPDIHRLNRIAEVTIHPTFIPKHIQHIHGHVQVYTSSNDQIPALQIPFDEIILHGSLDYEEENARFYLSSTNNELINENNEECRPIQFRNRYNIPVTVYNITTNHWHLLSPYMKINYPSSLRYLYPDQWTELLCITLRKQASPSVPFTNIQAILDIHTNLSYFHVPIYLYNGFLTLNLLTDHTNGGIRHNQTNPLELFVTSIPVNTLHAVIFVLTNPNPIDIEIDEFDSTLSNTDIQLDYMELLNGDKMKIRSEHSYKNKNISQLVIPAQHQAIFLLTINGTSEVKSYNESITFQTKFQTLRMNVNYRITAGSLEFTNKTPLHIDAFPNRVESVDLFVHNKFNAPVNVIRIDFIAYGVCFSFTWTETTTGCVKLQPNKIQRLGKLNFDMIPLCKSLPSESTCYCGLNHHPAFKQRWEEHISALNRYELDYILVTKFRSLWKEWTSLVRKQRIQTHIWLYTDRATIALPVSIGFVWPSVLEHMFSLLSRAPLILDFQVIFINITKTQNIIITNPSSDLLTYSVELLSNYSDDSKLVINDQTFTISTTSPRTDSINGTYSFNLRPTENITFTVSYRPTQTIKQEMYFVVRNNLTIIESILLRGEGGIGSLRIGNRKASSSVTPIIIAIDEKQFKLCSNSNGNPLLRKIITLYNTGNMKTIIYDISFDQAKCSGHGFVAPTCTNIEIESNEKYNLHILFQPDYTADEINRTLTLNTNIGLMTFPIIARIPQRVLSACYQIVPRPPWELRIYYLCLCSLLVLIILIFFTAGFDARKIFDDYLTRAEWRDRMQTTNNKIFDLSDLSSAVQDEEQTRERIESLSLVDTKKEKTGEMLKDEGKPKRPTTPIYDHKETSAKIRISTGSIASVRSTAAVGSKAIPQKIRRATTDSGSSKSAKLPQEPLPKTQPLQRRKSDQRTSPVVPAKVVSSSNVSDEENEPFVAARPRRVSGKAKESSTNITPKSTTENTTISSQPKSSLHSEQPDLLKLDNSTTDQQWKMVSSSKGQRKGTTPSRRQTTDESQINNKTVKAPSTNSENRPIPSLLSYTNSSASNRTTQSRRSRPTRNPSPPPIPNLAKRKSLQDNTPLFTANRELAFRQLAEQLWAAGLPSSTTACSMSIRSRCSSAPPSERGGGGGEDEITKSDWNEDDQQDSIDWDEPDVPDDAYVLPANFGRYALQSEYSMDESNDINERTQTQQKTTPSNTIPSLMSLSITPPTVTTNMQQKSTTPTSVVKENIEPLPFPSQSPGPIQRPNKLSCPPNAQSSSSTFFTDPTQSPSTPDVLVQINHLLDHQNSIATTPSTSSIHNSASSSTLNHDMPTPNVPWTPFSPTEWPSKYDSSWPMGNMQNPNVPLTTRLQNPFAQQQQQQQQISKEELAVWPTALGTATPRSTPLSTRSQQGSEWNGIFPSNVPSSMERTKPMNNSWSEFLPVSDSSSVDNLTPNRQVNEGNNPFWNPMTQSNASTSWWPKASSDEKTDDKDQSRWDFAR